MSRVNLRLSLALAFTAALLLAGVSRPRAADAQATTQTLRFTAPISTTSFVPCAAGGAGELVSITGDMRLIFHTTVNDNHFTASNHSRAIGFVVTGLTTGDTYHLVDVDNGVTSFQSDGGTFVITSPENFRLVGPGPDNNVLMHFLTHLTFNNSGELTSLNFDVNNECQ